MKIANQTGEIFLRTFEPNDQEQIAILCNNKKIWDNLRDFLPFPYTTQHARDFIDYCNQEEIPCTFGIFYRGELAGTIGLVLQKDIYRLSAEIGYWIGEPFWGLGIAPQAVELLTEYGFKQLKLARIYAGVFDFNKASQRVMEKAGFKMEGIFEKSVIKNGLICDEYRYAKINETSL